MREDDPARGSAGFKLLLHVAVAIVGPALFAGQGLWYMFALELVPGSTPPSFLAFMVFWVGVAARCAMMAGYFVYARDTAVAKAFAATSALFETMFAGFVASMLTGHVDVSQGGLFALNDLFAVAGSVIVVTACVFALFPKFASGVAARRHAR